MEEPELAIKEEEMYTGAECDGHPKQDATYFGNTVEVKEEPIDWPDLTDPLTLVSDNIVENDPLSINPDPVISSPVSFKTEKLVEKREKDAARNKPFTCHHCGSRFPFRSSLRVHIMNHIEVKPHSCGLCDYRTKYIWNLNVHMRIHNGEKLFACDACDYKCRTKQSLMKHKRNPTGSKPYACDVCSYRTASCSVLTRHLKSHLRSDAGENRSECNVCGDFKKFSSRCHEVSHSEEKPYACGECDDRFECSCSLRRHIRRVHTGRKHLSCDSCEFKCYQKDTLQKHIKKHHSGENPFSCAVCDYSCGSRKFLEFHMRLHTGILSFQCKMCHLEFKTLSILTRHMKKCNISEW